MHRARILVVDDNAAELERCVTALRALPDVETVGLLKSTDALARLSSESFDLLVTDLRMPMVSGQDLMRVAAAEDPDLPVLVLTGFPSVDTALSAMKEGAADYLSKPVHVAELQAVAARLLETRRLKGEHRLLARRLDIATEGADLVGASPAIAAMLDVLRRLAATDLDVLIVGETGTGKELVARRLHARAPSRTGRFVPVDCGAIPEALLESQLFGHERGAFSGADRRAIGLLEYADGGTFFLDELSSLPLALQAKLLRVLQERRFRRVGGTQEIPVSVRVVAAVNQPPEALVSRGQLREDLFHRLNVGRVNLPPLRERAGDVPLLAAHFLQRFGRDGAGVQAISQEAMTLLEAFRWPGNVRQLQNVLRRCLALASTDVLRTTDLPEELRPDLALGPPILAAGSFAEARERHVAAFERAYLEAVLRQHAGDVSQACEHSGISRATFYRLLGKHGVDPQRFRDS
jgi:DNA-binding NtrC family response regulator